MNETPALRCCNIKKVFGVFNRSCKKSAEFEIRDGDGLEDYTHSCRACVGDLLVDVPEIRIYPIGQQEVNP